MSSFLYWSCFSLIFQHFSKVYHFFLIWLARFVTDVKNWWDFLSITRPLKWHFCSVCCSGWPGLISPPMTSKIQVRLYLDINFSLVMVYKRFSTKKHSITQKSRVHIVCFVCNELSQKIMFSNNIALSVNEWMVYFFDFGFPRSFSFEARGLGCRVLGSLGALELDIWSAWNAAYMSMLFNLFQCVRLNVWCQLFFCGACELLLCGVSCVLIVVSIPEHFLQILRDIVSPSHTWWWRPEHLVHVNRSASGNRQDRLHRPFEPARLITTNKHIYKFIFTCEHY